MQNKTRYILWGLCLVILIISLVVSAYFLGVQNGIEQAYSEFEKAGISFENQNLP